MVVCIQKNYECKNKNLQRVHKNDSSGSAFIELRKFFNIQKQNYPKNSEEIDDKQNFEQEQRTRLKQQLSQRGIFITNINRENVEISTFTVNHEDKKEQTIFQPFSLKLRILIYCWKTLTSDNWWQYLL